MAEVNYAQHDAYKILRFRQFGSNPGSTLTPNFTSTSLIELQTLLAHMNMMMYSFLYKLSR